MEMSTDEGNSSDSDGFSCPICERTFTFKHSLGHHMKTFHPTVVFDFRFVCNICNEKFAYAADLQKHKDVSHAGVELPVEKKTFYSIEDFEEWKREVEENSQSQFIKHRGDEPLLDGRTAMYFYCHRSGSYAPNVNKGRKRRLKHIRMQEIGKRCPARITAYLTVVNEAMEIKVVYRGTHIGHEIEVEKLPLSKVENSHSAEQSNQGIPTSTSLDNLDGSYPATKHLGLTAAADLLNVSHDFKTNKSLIVHKSDVNISEPSSPLSTLPSPASHLSVLPPLSPSVLSLSALSPPASPLPALASPAPSLPALSSPLLPLPALSSSTSYLPTSPLFALPSHLPTLPLSVLHLPTLHSRTPSLPTLFSPSLSALPSPTPSLLALHSPLSSMPSSPAPMPSSPTIEEVKTAIWVQFQNLLNKCNSMEELKNLNEIISIMEATLVLTQ